MDRKLIDFVRILRNADVRVSPSESMDAMQAIALVGYDDRSLIKRALSTTLAKSEAEKQRFDYCFEHFFSLAQHDGLAANPEQAKYPATPEEASEDRAAAPGIAAGLDELSELLLDGNSDAIAAEIVRAGDAVDVSAMRIFTQKGQYTRRLVQHMGLADLDASIQALEQGSDPDHHQQAAALTAARQALLDKARDYVEQQYLLYASNAGQQLREDVLRNARLSSLDAHYFRDMQMLVQRMAKKLASQHSRRKKVYRKGQLNAGKTIRRNVANDGILFDTHWRFKRKDRPSVLAVCDVSGSVSLYARFLLILLYSLHDVLPKVRAFAFSSNLGEVTDTLARHPVEKAIELINHDWGMGSTDYGAALRTLGELCLDDVDRHTTIIMLGDGRNNYGPHEAELLKQFYQRGQRLLWLNPENRSSWGTGDSEMLRYAVYCHEAAVCNTLGQLEKIVSRLLRLTL